MIYRIRTARKPRSTNPAAPQFQDTILMLIRILLNAAKPDAAPSINTESTAFKNKISLDSASNEFFTHARFTLIDGRFHVPEPTSDNVQFLKRCAFQLQMMLLEENPSLLTDPIFPAYASILERMGCANYERNPNSKILNLSEKSTLMSEQHSALGKLGCLTDMSDNIVIDAFQTQVAHDVTVAHPLVDLLQEAQKQRKSEQLGIEIACQRSEGVVTTAELGKAYRDFEIPNNGEGINNDVLVGLIRGSLVPGSKESIRIISKARNDSSIYELLEQPSMIVPQEEDPFLDIFYAQNPVGLSNIGNTCYLNSLLQYIYTIKEIRETVMEMEAHVENEDDNNWKEKAIDGRILNRRDVKEAKEIVVRELRRLFSSMRSSRARSVTPSDRLVELLLSTGKDGQTDSNVSRKPNQSFEQQDVSETMSILMYRLSTAFKPILSESEMKPVDRFNNMFYVKANRKAVETNEATGVKETRLIPEDFSTLMLNVEEDMTMEELIDDYFDPGGPGLDTNHQDDPPNSGDSTTQHDRDITVTDLPPILQVHLMRTQFNREEKISYKSNAIVSIPKRVFLDQYLESNQEGNADRIKRMKLLKKDRRQCRRALSNIKQKLKERASLGNTAPSIATPGGTPSAANEVASSANDTSYSPRESTAVANASLSNRQLDITDSTVDSALDMEEAVKVMDISAKLQSEVADLNQTEYKIHAVFHHHGGAEYGHYWVYILDDQSDEPRWFKYSDDVVSEVGPAQESEVFNGDQGSTTELLDNF
ncbi:ubiquitin-specific protease ubp2 [Gamsiella multidivaricata]|nr:ubiquitin-specific protease ubp2 [Gamsiella multidivaricata]